MIPDTPPPPHQTATLAEREEKPRQAVTLTPRRSMEAATTTSGREDVLTAKANSRPHLPPKPKVRSQPSLESSLTTTAAKAAATSSSSKENRTGEAPPTSPPCAPATVRVKGSIGRQLAQRARSMGLQSAVKSKAKPQQAKQTVEDRTLHASTPATETGGTEMVEAEGGPTSSTGNNPAPSGHGTSPTAAHEDTPADLPAPVLVCPREDGALVELGPLYKRTTPSSDDAAPAMEANQQTANTWMVDMDGELRALPSMPDWVQEALAYRPTQAVPASFTPSRGRRDRREGSHRRVDPDSSTSIEVTRVKRPRSRTRTTYIKPDSRASTIIGASQHDDTRRRHGKCRAPPL